MAGRREVIRPEWDPIVITLDKNPDQCVQREGQYGVDYQYIVNSDSGIMWLPKDGRDALVSSGARAGDQVEICKSQRGRKITYIATRISEEEPREPQRVQQPMQQQAPPRQIAAAAPVAQPVSEVHPVTQILTACLRCAIDAMVEARAHAASKQLELDGPSWEDVRALANTVYINRVGNK